jgi:hypothetical protein
MDRAGAEALLAAVRQAKDTADLRPGIDRPAEVIGGVEWFRRADRTDDALEMAARMPSWWLAIGQGAAGRRLLATVLNDQAASESRWRARALIAVGELAFGERRPDANAEARDAYTAALGAAEASGDSDSIRRALVGLARTALRDGQYERVRDLGARAQAIARESGDRAGEWLPLHMQAAASRMLDDRSEAWRLYRTSVALAEEIGSVARVAIEQHNMGYLALRDGDLDEAKALFGAAASAARPLADRYLLPYLVLDLAAIAVAEGRHRDGARMIGLVTTQLEADGVVLDPDDDVELGAMTQRARAALGAAFERECATGIDLGVDEVLAAAYGPPTRATPP